MTKSTMIQTVREMSPKDRIQLMQVILEAMAADSESMVLSDEQKTELDRRIADDDALPDDGVSWDQVLGAARARHGR